jgi:hypothetical protein
MLFLQIPEGSLQGYEAHETLVLAKYQVLQGRAFSFNKTLVCAVWHHDRLEQISSHQVLAALQAAAASIGSACLSFKPNEDPRQHNHRDNAKTRLNIGGDMSRRVQLPAFSRFN